MEQVFFSTINCVYYSTLPHHVLYHHHVSVQLNCGPRAKIDVSSKPIVCPQEKVTEERVQGLKQRFMSAYDVTADGKLQIQEV